MKPIKPIKCEMCGAPLHGYKCEYCGTEYEQEKSEREDPSQKNMPKISEFEKAAIRQSLQADQMSLSSYLQSQMAQCCCDLSTRQMQYYNGVKYGIL